MHHQDRVRHNNMSVDKNTSTVVGNNDNTNNNYANNESSLRSYDVDNLRLSYEMAVHAYQNGCMPFGAVLADKNGSIIVKAFNPTKASNKRGGSSDVDPTGHAETTLLRNPDWWSLTPEQRSKATLYSSTEPCVMCAGAIYWSGIGRVVYGCSALQLEQQVSGPGGFDIPIRDLYSQARPGSRCIDIVGPICSEEGIQVHKDSGIWKKKK